MTIVKGFGERVARARRQKAARDDRDITQKEIAEAVGVGESSVGRWEKGTVPKNAATLDALAAYLGVDPEWLLGGHASSERVLEMRTATAEEIKPSRAKRGKTGTD